MSDLEGLTLEQLTQAKTELSRLLKNKKAAAKRARKGPVRLGELKNGEAAVLVQPQGRVGAPTKLSRETLSLVFSEDYRDELERFARGEDVDVEAFQVEQDEDDQETSDEEE